MVALLKDGLAVLGLLWLGVRVYDQLTWKQQLRAAIIEERARGAPAPHAR